MEIILPKTSTILSNLLRADLTTLWRNRRAAIMVLVVPIIILLTWRPMIAVVGGPFVLATCITLGLISIGLMGYSNSIARDRDKGVFQRLRVSPVPTWCIMGSRLLVQLMMIMVLTLLVFVVGYQYDQIQLSLAGYLLTFFAAIVGGSVYLSLGQVIVGRVQSPEAVNSTTRLVYFVFIMVGMVGDLMKLPKEVKQALRYSPYGTVKNVLAASMQPAHWTSDTTIYLLITVGYAIVFTFLGVRWFKWK